MASQPCLFCDIIKEQTPEKILYEDDLVVAFSDIRPAAPYHYLIVTKEHIPDARSLVPEQKPLVEHMMKVANELLSGKSTSSRLGFHWPPFRTVSHLHLHAIAPVEDMSFWSRMMFKENSYCWIICLKGCQHNMYCI